MPQAQFRKGDLVRFRLGTRAVQGEVKEDRGPIGIRGRHLYLVEFRTEPQSVSLSLRSNCLRINSKRWETPFRGNKRRGRKGRQASFRSNEAYPLSRSVKSGSVGVRVHLGPDGAARRAAHGAGDRSIGPRRWRVVRAVVSGHA